MKKINSVRAMKKRGKFGRKCKICNLPDKLRRNIDFDIVQRMPKAEIMRKYKDYKEMEGLYWSLDRHIKNDHILKNLIELHKLTVEEVTAVAGDIATGKVQKLKELVVKTPEEVARERYYNSLKWQDPPAEIVRPEKPVPHHQRRMTLSKAVFTRPAQQQFAMLPVIPLPPK